MIANFQKNPIDAFPARISAMLHAPLTLMLGGKNSSLSNRSLCSAPSAKSATSLFQLSDFPSSHHNPLLDLICISFTFLINHGFPQEVSLLDDEAVDGGGYRAARASLDGVETIQCGGVGVAIKMENLDDSIEALPLPPCVFKCN